MKRQIRIEKQSPSYCQCSFVPWGWERGRCGSMCVRGQAYEKRVRVEYLRVGIII